MAQLLNRVQPGDIITAEMWNLAVDAVNELLLAGQTTGIQITTLLPAGTPEDPIRIGSVQQISGQSFGYSIGQSTVTFQGPSGPVVVARNDMLVGSSDTRLLFTMPPVPNLPQSGAAISMRVDNGVAHDTRTVFVQPVVLTVSGDVFVNWSASVSPNPNPNPIQTGAQARFFYQVQTGINIPATFSLSANITSATTTVPPGLVSSIEFQTEDGTLISGNQIAMGRNETRNVIVRIPSIPASFAAQSFTLETRATSGNVQGSDARSFTVGQAVTPADPNIVAELTGATVLNATGSPDPGGGSLEGSTVRLQPGRQMRLLFKVQLLAVGSYDLTIQPQTGSTLSGWDLGLANPTSPVQVTTPNDQQQIRNVNFRITRTAAATAGGTLIVRIQGQGATGDWHRQFQLELMS